MSDCSLRVGGRGSGRFEFVAKKCEISRLRSCNLTRHYDPYMSLHRGHMSPPETLLGKFCGIV